MPPQSHFIAFSDMKCKHVSNALKDSSCCVISYIPPGA